MNRKQPIALGALVFFWFVCAAAAAQPRREAPPMTAAEIPAPPQQKLAWNAPASALPEALVSAITLLFDQGLADPRGCEYREVEIGVGSAWGGSGVVKTRAWVLPAAASGAKQRFGVAWNGLAYPLVSVGQSAVVRDDVLAILRADEDVRAAAAKREAKFPFSRSTGHATDEGKSVSHTAMEPIKVCLLLRAGEVELAQKYWDAFAAGLPSNTDNNDKNRADPYLMLASDWAWALFDRAVCAHMRGDDALALASCRALEPVGAAIDAAATQRGFKENVNGSIKQQASFVPFLQQLPRLREDQERRAKEAAALAAAPAAPPADAAARIRALIHDLQQVAARQQGQPGGLSLSDSPTVAALVKEGEAAVEPLLACIESDRRLTRSVSFGRDFFRGRTFHGADEAAYAAVTQILEIRSFATANRQATLADLRGVWEKTKGKPPSARWLAALADDAATPQQWLEAAGRIVQPVDVEVRGGWVTVPQRKPGEIPAMRGEALRNAKDPSVAELMARRCDALANSGRPGSEQGFNMQKACDVALQLAKWDGAASIPVLRRQIVRSQTYVAGQRTPGDPFVAQPLAARVARMTLAARRAGDAEALGEYAKWLTAAKPQDVADQMSEVLEPLWRYPGDPAMARAAQAMFGEAKSLWRTALAPGGARFGRRGPQGLVASPLISLPPVRDLVAEMLKEQSQAGTASVRDGQLSIKADGGSMGIGLRNAADPLALRATEPFPVRACDLLAMSLAQVDGMPLFEAYWPRDQRDQAIARISAFLARYGERYQYSEEQRQLWRWPDQAIAVMAFPALDHPATAAEAADGRAVFSLADQKGEVRRFKLDHAPLNAKWVTLKDYPRQVQSYPVDGKNGPVTSIQYEQDGRVWQAEELRAADGAWHRFYGFVGAHTVAKVPADEVDFPEDWYRWGALTGRFDLQVEPPGVSYASPAVRTEPAALNGPLRVTARIRNRSGLEQQAPTEFYRGGAVPALHPALRVELGYAPPPVGEARQQIIDWQPLQPRKLAPLQIQIANARTPLAPAQAIDAFTFDLRELFDIDRPGRYRLIIHVANDSGLGEGKSNEPVFELIGP